MSISGSIPKTIARTSWWKGLNRGHYRTIYYSVMHTPIIKSFGLYGLLFFVFFLFFAAFAPLGQVVSDTAYSVETAKSLYYRHSFAIEKNWELRYAAPGKDGHYYSKFGVGYALSFLPQVACAQLLSRIVPIDKKYIEQAVVGFTNTFYASCIAVAMFVLLSILGYRKRRIFITVGFICAASILLPYSKIVQSETMTALLFIIFLIIVAYDREVKFKTGCVLGGLYAILYFIKPINIVFGSVLGLYVAVRFFQKRANVSGCIGFCVFATVPLAFLLYFNWHRFGSIFEFGYGEQQFLFTTPLWRGLTGFLFSPSKSIFIFSPLIVFSFLGFKRFYLKHQSVALCIAGVGILFILLYAKWFDWKGGWSWGPRLVVPAIMLFHIVLIEFFDREKIKKTAWASFAVVAFVSAGIQFVASMVSYQQVHYFYSDPMSKKNSQIEVAARLFIHKAQGKAERYPCEMFRLDCDSAAYERDGKMFGGKVLAFDDKETFQGFATIWSGLSHNFGWHICGYIPWALLLLSMGCGWRVYALMG
jgi:hypothetical protein